MRKGTNIKRRTNWRPIRDMKGAPSVEFIQFDEDIMKWFESLGPSYETRINRVLRAYMEQHKRNSRKR